MDGWRCAYAIEELTRGAVPRATIANDMGWPKGIGLTDAGWVAFTTTWKGPQRERRADAAADLRERLKAERPAGKLKGLADVIAVVAEVIADE